MPHHHDLEHRQPLFDAYIANALELEAQGIFEGTSLNGEDLERMVPASIGKHGQIVAPETYDPRNGPALLVLTPDEKRTVHLDGLAKSTRLRLQASFGKKFYRPGNPESVEPAPFHGDVVTTRIMPETRERIDYTRVPLLQVGWYTPNDPAGMAAEIARGKFIWDQRVKGLNAQQVRTQDADSREMVRIDRGARRQGYELMGRLGILEGQPDAELLVRQLQKLQLLHLFNHESFTPLDLGAKVTEIVAERVHGGDRVESLRSTIGVVVLDKLLGNPEFYDDYLTIIRQTRFRPR